MSAQVLIAVDPGASGGIAVAIDNEVLAYRMPATEGDIVTLLKNAFHASPWEPGRAIIEEVSGYAGEKQPGSAMFTFGRNYGFVIGILQTLGFRIELVRPQVWQKGLGLGTSGRRRAPNGASAAVKKQFADFNARAKKEWKHKLQEKAQQLFPALKVTLATADALLLLEWARRTQIKPPF